MYKKRQFISCCACCISACVTRQNSNIYRIFIIISFILKFKQGFPVALTAVIPEKLAKITQQKQNDPFSLTNL
jgi:hypothetical protein